MLNFFLTDVTQKVSHRRAQITYTDGTEFCVFCELICALLCETFRVTSARNPHLITIEKNSHHWPGIIRKNHARSSAGHAFCRQLVARICAYLPAIPWPDIYSTRPASHRPRTNRLGKLVPTPKNGMAVLRHRPDGAARLAFVEIWRKQCVY